jgi:hypothetical protein
VLEQAKAHREAAAQAEAKAAAERAAALLEAQQAKLEAERAHKKALIAQYQQQQEEKHREEAAKALEEAAALMAEKLAVADYNLKRVEFRNEEAERRRKAKAEAEEHERLLGEEKLLRLQQFHERVVASLHVPDDPERIFQDTAATSAQTQARNELFPVYGYADETLMKDVRFKLGHALRNAGMHGTDYARQILTSERFNKPSRPDATVSNFSLGYDHA